MASHWSRCWRCGWGGPRPWSTSTRSPSSTALRAATATCGGRCHGAPTRAGARRPRRPRCRCSAWRCRGSGTGSCAAAAPSAAASRTPTRPPSCPPSPPASTPRWCVTGPDGRRERSRPASSSPARCTTDLGPAEVLTEVRFPVARPGDGLGFGEFARRHGDFALAGRRGPRARSSEADARPRFGISDQPVTRDVERSAARPPICDGAAAGRARRRASWTRRATCTPARRTGAS